MLDSTLTADGSLVLEAFRLGQVFSLYSLRLGSLFLRSTLGFQSLVAGDRAKGFLDLPSCRASFASPLATAQMVDGSNIVVADSVRVRVAGDTVL